MISIEHFQCSSSRFQSDSSLVYRLCILYEGWILLVGFTVFVLILWVRERDPKVSIAFTLNLFLQERKVILINTNQNHF